MNKNLKIRAIVWEIIVPIVLYYIVFLSAMYFILRSSDTQLRHT